MGFAPAMTAELSGIQAVSPLHFRRWNGVIADLWHAKGEEGGRGFYIAPYPRIVLFDEDAASAITFFEGNAPRKGVSALFVPAHMPMRSQMSQARRFSHVDLHLEQTPLRKRLSGLTLRRSLDQPVFLDRGSRIHDLTRLLAHEIAQPTRSALMLEGLLLATLAEIFEAMPEEDLPGARQSLAPHQVQAVARLVDTRLDHPPSVAEMAEAAGLSESWFAHAFKQSTGQSPLKWQISRRIKAAATLMQRDADASLAEIAAATGFTDQSHLTRAFRALHGMPPAAWRKRHMAAFAAEAFN
ncbi:helix-turn-helix domain-containing protein [Gemmobacter serpentinus]|uniref:helix-turn-helix domain-containing protein n=1 Tax=Gemmobacter serpentinus TaxID=2652247 RepID=UPI00124F61C4|nr:AraC family transcriptional regulator [Gemmobacter serpentinus]